MTAPILTPRRRTRRRPWRFVAASLGVLAVLAAGLAPAVLARDNSWSLTRTPPSVPVNQPTTITFVATNGSDGGGGGEIGCITLVIPSVFSVGTVTVTSEPAGASWTDSDAPGPGGSTIVSLRAADDDSVLAGDPDNDVLRFTVRVTGDTQGPTTWVADVYNKIDCDNDMGLTKNINVTVSASGGATPTPTAPPTPAPTPPPTPAPTPPPTPAPTPPPTPAPTPPPGATPTPPPGATPTPPPGATPTPPPGATPTPPPGTTPPPSASVAPGASPSSGVSAPPTTAAPSGSPSPPPSSSPPSSSAPGTPPAAGGAGGDPPPGEAFALSGSAADEADAGMFGDTLSQFATLFGRAFDWAVPGLLLSVPGLLLVLAIAAQALGALAWLPLVRRRIGGFGLRSETGTSHP